MQDSIAVQIFVGVFLLMLSGMSAFLLTALVNAQREIAAIKTNLAVALNDIEHLKTKADTHTNHIDTLFQMKTDVATIMADIASLNKVLPQVMTIMQQLTAIAVKRAA